jgi:hypothetical protein
VLILQVESLVILLHVIFSSVELSRFAFLKFHCKTRSKASLGWSHLDAASLSLFRIALPKIALHVGKEVLQFPRASLHKRHGLAQ